MPINNNKTMQKERERERERERESLKSEMMIMPKSEFINKEPAAGCIENAHHRHSEDLASEVCRLVELLSST